MRRFLIIKSAGPPPGFEAVTRNVRRKGQTYQQVFYVKHGNPFHTAENPDQPVLFNHDLPETARIPHDGKMYSHTPEGTQEGLFNRAHDEDLARVQARTTHGNVTKMGDHFVVKRADGKHAVIHPGTGNPVTDWHDHPSNAIKQHASSLMVKAQGLPRVQPKPAKPAFRAVSIQQATIHKTPELQRAGHTIVQNANNPNQEHHVPTHLVPHHLDDMNHTVTSSNPNHPNPHVDAVLKGAAKHLGRGQDGSVFKHGAKTVKVSTVTPYQASNWMSYRSPEEARDHIKTGVERTEKLRAAGVPGIPKTEYHEHEGRGFAVRDHLRIPEKLTQEHLDQVQKSVIALHQHGHVIGDQPQVGVDKHGNIQHFDLGQARQIKPGGMWDDRDDDVAHVKRLYEKHGGTYKPLGGHFTKQHFENAVNGLVGAKEHDNDNGDAWEQKAHEAHAMHTDDLRKTHTGSTLERHLKEADDTLEQNIRMARKYSKRGQFMKAHATGYPLRGRMKYFGMDISLENKAGDVREGTDADGHAWKRTMHFDYGYVRGTEGVDGDHLDVYIGPDTTNAREAYIVHQLDPVTGKYDEDKVMLGFSSQTQAKTAYLKQYDRPGFYGGMTSMSIITLSDLVRAGKIKGHVVMGDAHPRTPPKEMRTLLEIARDSKTIAL